MSGRKVYEPRGKETLKCICCGESQLETKFQIYYYTPKPKKDVSFPTEKKRSKICKTCSTKRKRALEKLEQDSESNTSVVSAWIDDLGNHQSESEVL